MSTKENLNIKVKDKRDFKIIINFKNNNLG